ncbi:hypothetical protein L6164_013299 [Bauhinia variegata]|uniref:Uncharacterized protein n=1 Tax=Bauhinia variegata TaxID=167791 RepID=A0ACB9PCK8_BAUVA|nr:hypothetical protein L6164_013299 [Bauhinia variegata]
MEYVYAAFWACSSFLLSSLLKRRARLLAQIVLDLRAMKLSALPCYLRKLVLPCLFCLDLHLLHFRLLVLLS